jgi:hypothetical protein
MADVIGNKTDSAASGVVSTTESIMAYVKQLVTANMPQCVEKSDGACLNNLTDDLFTITGGLIRCKIVGFVSTVLVGTTNLRLKFTSTTPAATIDLNAGAVACDNDAAGTIYYNVGATSVFTPASSLGGKILDPVTVEETEFILSAGSIGCLSSAAATGNIKWYLSYTPLSPNTVVVAAA